jgi:integrase/recombinase XerD
VKEMIFTSPIGPLIRRYLAMKQASGRRAVSMAYTFRYLDRFLVSSHAPDLTQETFLAWSQTMESLCATTRAGRLRIVHNFCLFRRREHPNGFVPDPKQFPRTSPRPLPYIYSEADIIRLLAASEDLLPHKGSLLHGAVARIGIVILYTTGLRRGELVRLTLGDYDRTNRVFHVRRTKFDKSRLVPLANDTVMELDRYLKARQKAGAPCHEDAPLLVHNHGAPFRSYTGCGFGELLRKLIRATDIRTSRGRPPRIHDLRFTFAVQALSRWYRAGADVQARLPALATYLGHVSIVSTQYYLTFFPATAEAASEMFRAHAAVWLSPSRLEGDC